jgi:hypothetical protein
VGVRIISTNDEVASFYNVGDGWKLYQRFTPENKEAFEWLSNPAGKRFKLSGEVLNSGIRSEVAITQIDTSLSSVD